MGKQVVTLLTDDLDGSEADRTVEFGLVVQPGIII
jgi:hypothetical protein